jgi:hypothetical protein
MGLRFIRQPSDTPSVSNADDAVMVRYAYGGYDGYIKGKGAELSYTINGTIFRINSGVLSLQGYETEIDANGWELDVGTIPTTQYFSIYYEVNLATQATDIKSTYDTAGYPTISSGDDLNANITGTARLLLYRVRANNGVISVVNKMVMPIQYTKDLKDDLLDGSTAVKHATNVISKIGGVDLGDIFESDGKKVKNASLADTAISANSATRATYASTDTSKGTIEERLTNLGFKSGTVSVAYSGTASVNYVYRQGNYIIGKVVVSNVGSGTSPKDGATLFTIPSNFRPKNTITTKIACDLLLTQGYGFVTATLTISTSGNAVISNVNHSNYTRIRGYELILGYEANPL